MTNPLSALLRALGCAAFATATTAVAQSTAWIPCAADNTLYESATGALSNGAGAGLFVGRSGNGDVRRAVLRFDVAANVPAGAAIVAASLTLRIAQSGFAAPLEVTGHRLLQAWDEGTSNATAGGGGGGVAATPGDATWLHAQWPASLWSSAGGDFAAAASLALTTPQLGVVTSPPSAGAVADVQLWLDQPAQNHGWLLRSDEVLTSTARRIDSRESTGLGPFLAVSYVVPGQAGVWGRGCPVGSGAFELVLVGAPIGGQTMQHVHFGGPANGIAISYFALGLEPAGIVLQPDCRLYLSPTAGWIPGNVFLLDAFGTGVTAWTHTTSFPGLYFATQSAALDGSPLGLALTNAGVAVLQ